MNAGLEAFLSEAAIREHKEYLCTLKHKASIYKKSGVDVSEPWRSGAGNIPREERGKIKKLDRDIKMHEIYFNSFGNSFIPCPKIKECFGSENNFAYLLSELAKEKNSGFIAVFSDRRGRINFADFESLPYGAEIHLSLDLDEHAYFRDYGFKRDAYIRAALAHLDFSRINCRFSEK